MELKRKNMTEKGGKWKSFIVKINLQVGSKIIHTKCSLYNKEKINDNDPNPSWLSAN